MANKTVDFTLTRLYGETVYQNGDNEWGLPEDEKGNLVVAQPDVLTIELYKLPTADGKGYAFGARVLPPAGTTKDTFAKQETRLTKVHPLFGEVYNLLKMAGMLDECKEIAMLDGTVIDTSKATMEGFIANMVKEELRSVYEEKVSEGIVPKSVTFDEWLEVQLAEAGMSGGTVH